MVKSTYGDRLHEAVDPKEELYEIVTRAYRRGGIVVIPSFAVGRAQAILYYLHLLKEEKRIPDIPIYLNSPMAVDATRVYEKHHAEHRLNPEQCGD